MGHPITVGTETSIFFNFFGRSRTSTAKMPSQTRTANFDTLWIITYKPHSPELMINFILRNGNIFNDSPRSS